MKAGAITFRLMISFLLVAITASGVARENEVVLDYYGNPVKTNTPYVVHKKFPDEFWITPYIIESTPEICMDGVRFSRFAEKAYVLFVSSSDEVRLSTELNIDFAEERVCSTYAYWRVGRAGTEYEDRVLLGGSKLGNDSMFTIENSKERYKFARYKFAFKGIDIGYVPYTQQKLRLLREPSSSENTVVEFNFFPVPVRQL